MECGGRAAHPIFRIFTSFSIPWRSRIQNPRSGSDHPLQFWLKRILLFHRYGSLTSAPAASSACSYEFSSHMISWFSAYCFPLSVVLHVRVFSCFLPRC